MSKRHTARLHHVITVYNLMFHHMDGVMRHLAKQMFRWKEDLFFAVKLVRQMVPKALTQVTPSTGMVTMTGHILDPFRTLWSFGKLEKGMVINPEDETSYTMQYQDAFLKYVENEYYANHWCVPVKKTRTRTEEQSYLLWIGFRILSIILWSIWFVQQWWRIPNAWQCGWDGTRTKWSRSTLIDCRPGSIWIHHLKHPRTGVKLIQISMRPLWPNVD